MRCGVVSVVIVLIVLMLAGCEVRGEGDQLSDGSSAQQESQPDAPVEEPSEPSELAELSVRWEQVADEFDEPVQVLEDPRDGTTLVVERGGGLRTLDGEEVTFINVVTDGEHGLLSATFSPDGEHLFVYYSFDAEHTFLSSVSTTDPGGLTEGRRQVTFEQPATNHNGGGMVFLPDGSLVLGLGDGGGGGDPFENGQDPDTPLGALLRFEVSGGELRPHPDNPFPGGPAPEVWAYGLRNPWRLDVDDEWLYVADVGQDSREEINAIRIDEVAGKNFGWPVMEGSECFQGRSCSPEGMITPVAEHTHDDGACSVIGGVVVPAGDLEPLAGAFLYSDLCDHRLHAVRMGADGTTETATLEGGALDGTPLGFGSTSDGRVFVTLVDGRVLELGLG